ncbi:MAG TPA: hypothetical protein PKW15_00100 [Alphaproteobacteria bacterium]|nr:hypothetical protein [Rhodospirillaceae bacterium]HRJ11625.1 hypothetical protein [Alphaproteobacteria bacterium]
MFNILLILVFVGGIVIAAVFAGVTFLQGVRNAQEIQITKQRLVETAARIQSQARYVSGELALPQGASGSSPYGYNQVPTWISSHARNAGGVPFLYCPYRSATGGGTASTVTMPSGTTYDVNYTNNASTISQNYVTDGDAPPAAAPSGTVGLLIAAAPQSNQPPDCDDITAASDGTPVVTGGIVVPIQDNFLNKMKMQTAPTDLRIYINSIASGDGSGRDTNNYATITTAMNMLSYVKPAQVTLYFNSAATFPSTISWGGRVHLEAASTATTVRISGLVIDEFSMVSARNITFRTDGGVTINGELQLHAANLTTNAGAPTGANIYGGRLTSFGSNTITGNITIDGGGSLTHSNEMGTLTISSIGDRGLKIVNGDFSNDRQTMYLNIASANIVPIYIGAGGLISSSGHFYVNNANVSNITGGMVVDPGGMFSFAGGGRYLYVIRPTSYAAYIHGTLGLVGAGKVQIQNNAPTYGVVLASGGALYVSQNAGGTAIGANNSLYRPTTGLYDNGGNRFIMAGDGSASNIEGSSGGACWGGRSGTNLFSDPLSGTNTGNTNGHLTYTNNSTTMKWLRFYNQSWSSCVK